MSEMGANALLPTGGAGGLALGAWALKRGGMPTAEIAWRTAAFFMLTSVANVAGVVLIGVGLAVQLLPGETNLALTLLPAAIAAAAIGCSLLAGRSSAGLHRRLDRKEASGASSRRSTLALKTLVAIADGVNEAVALLREGNAWLIGGILAYLIFDVLILWATFRAFGASAAAGDPGDGLLIGGARGLIPVPGGSVALTRASWERSCCTRADHRRSLCGARVSSDRAVGPRDPRVRRVRLAASNPAPRVRRDRRLRTPDRDGGHRLGSVLIGPESTVPQL